MKKIILILLFCILMMSGCNSSNRPFPDENSKTPIVSEGEPTNTPVTVSPSPTITSPTPAPSSPSPSQIQNTDNKAVESPSPSASSNQNKGEEGGGKVSVPAENSGDSNNATDGQNPLKGKIICIDPGHGNPEMKGKQEKIAPNSSETKPALAYGATGIKSKTPEYKINMVVSLMLKDLFEAQGATVIMTRQSDKENLGNIDRAVIGNEAESDLVIRIHSDGSDNQEVNGVSVLYPGSKYISDNSMLSKSKSAAQFVLDSIIDATGAHPRGIVKRDDLTGFNWSTQTTILVEMGFLSNPKEDQLLNDSAYQKKIADGIIEGAREFFKSKAK